MYRRSLIAIVLVMGCLSAANAAPQATQKQSNGRKDKAGPAIGTVDLNTASEKDLDSLPGVGPATAKKIMDHRPFRSVDDLAKAGLATKEIERIRTMVTVGHTQSASSAVPSAPVPSVPSQSAPKALPVPAPTQSADRSNSGRATPPPAGSGMVWVNTETKIYHRQGDRWYGNTKHGSYMTESDAIQAGNRAEKHR